MTDVTPRRESGSDVEGDAFLNVNQECERRRPSPETGSQPLRLLVVDDDDNYRSYISALTRRLGFRVDTAEDGAVALDRLADEQYDIAIIDNEMPRLKGIEAIGKIRSGDSNRNLYAVMLTSRDDLDTKVAALGAGFDDFLTKSASEAEISAKLLAARRLAVQQRTLNFAIRDLYGLATRDDLTGTFNRRYFFAEAERVLNDIGQLNLVLLDLDGFKRVNDRYGHAAGDRVLRDVGMALRDSTRPEDTVARLGGDEFAVAFANSDASAIDEIAERLVKAVEDLEWTFSDTFRVGVSAGIAASRVFENPTVRQLLAAADRDMYRDKRERTMTIRPTADAPRSTDEQPSIESLLRPERPPEIS